MSGLSHTPGKRAWGYTHRGFESRLFRQLVNEYGASRPVFHLSPHLTQQPNKRLETVGFFVVHDLSCVRV